MNSSRNSGIIGLAIIAQLDYFLKMNTDVLSDVVDTVYDKLESDEPNLVSNMQEGKVFVRKLIQDYGQFKDILSANYISRNKRGWLTNMPISLTIEIINRETVPGRIVHVNLGYKRHLLVYYGICPELESFVNLVLWPNAESSNTSNQAYKNIFEMVTADKDRKNIIIFGDGVELELINSIHPSRCKDIKTIQKPKNVYDWEYIPFIKESGDTILSHSSPLNFKRVCLDELRLRRTYINPKVIVGRLTSFKGNNIEILTPIIYGQWRQYLAKISDKVSNTLNKSLLNSLNYFLIFESLNENVEDIVESMVPASPIDLFGHFLSFLLYTLRVNNKRLFVLLESQYEKLYKQMFKLIDNFCRRENPHYSGLWDAYNIFQAYLSPYFRIIDKGIYFIPRNQSQLSNQMMLIYDRGLQIGADSISEVARSMGIREKLTYNDLRTYDFIKLLNALKRHLVWNQDRDFLCKKLKQLL